MFGLDVTYDIPFPPDFLDTLASKNDVLGSFVRDSSQFYMDFYSQGLPERVCYFHDVFPLAFLVQPELFAFTSGHARVGTGELDRGQTSIAPAGTTPSPLWLEAPIIDVATKVDHSALTQLLLDTYAR
jgi:inosine-uridine nucleoside N-ribohydrolase